MLQRSPPDLTWPARRWPPLNRRLRTGAIVSLLGHLFVILALLVGLPLTPAAPPPEPETGIEMVFDTKPQKTAKAPTPSPKPAPPAKDPAPPAPPVTEPPRSEPEAPPPPPPPPPPPRPPARASRVPLPVPPPDLPPPAPSPMPSPVVPPPPAPPPVRPAPAAKPDPTPPMPPPPVPPPPAPPGRTAQPAPAPETAPDSSAMEATLRRLRQTQRQTEPPRAPPNPRAGGYPNAGGSPAGDNTAALDESQRGAIGDHVRECWTKDGAALNLDRMSVVLIVLTDASGTVRQADVGEEDRGRLSDPIFRAFAERARRAVLDVRCATLPLPRQLLGRGGSLTFRFRP